MRIPWLSDCFDRWEEEADARAREAVKHLSGVEADVIYFTLIETAAGPKDAHPEADLYGDIGVYGDDVVEFFEAFCTRFGFPVEEVDISDCFPGEGWDLCLPPTWLFKPKRRIRVKHLIRAVETGVWPELESVR